MVENNSQRQLTSEQLSKLIMFGIASSLYASGIVFREDVFLQICSDFMAILNNAPMDKVEEWHEARRLLHKELEDKSFACMAVGGEA